MTTEEAFLAASAAVTEWVEQVESRRWALVLAFGRAAADDYATRAAHVRKLWAASWSAWNTGSIQAAGSGMQRAVREAGQLATDIENRASGRVDEISGPDPLSPLFGASAALDAAKEALRGVGFEPPDIVPTWLKAAVAVAVVVLVWRLSK